jgi:outer membrane protein assembly factor BamB
MRNIFKISFSILLSLLFFFCSASFQFKDFKTIQDSDWVKYKRDLENSGYVRKNIPTPNKLLWKTGLKGSIVAPPLATNGIIIVGSLDKKLFFISASSGKKLRSFSFSGEISSSPALLDTVLYLATEGEDENLYALDLLNGKLIWHKRLKGSSAHVILEDRLFIGTEDGYLICLNNLSGEEVWRFKTEGEIKSTPANKDGKLYFGSADNYLYSLDKKTGKLIWKFKTDAGIFSSPSIKDSMVFFGSLDGALYVLNSERGDLIWEFKTEGKIYSSPSVSESSVYFGSNDNYLYDVDILSGKLLWKFKTGSLIHSSPLIMGDKIFFGSFDGFFYVLDSKNGGLLWKFETFDMISSSAIYYQGRIYIGSQDGYLYCFGN